MYNAASTGGTNYGPSNPDHLKAVQERLDALTKQEGVQASQVPSEMVTASRHGSAYSTGRGGVAGSTSRVGAGGAHRPGA